MHEKLEELIRGFREKEGNVISLLQETQDVFGYIPEEAVFYYSKELDIPASTFYGVVTFYAQFYLKPRGKHIITACCGTACHVKGAERLINNIKRDLQLHEGETTTKDLNFTLEQVACVGTCSLAPVIIINKKVHGKMTPDRLARELRALHLNPESEQIEEEEQQGNE